MAIRERAAAVAGAAFDDPERLARVGAAAIAVLLLSLGLLALAELAEPGAVAPADLRSAADGPVVVAGEIARLFAEGQPPSTLVYLRGQDAVAFRLATDLTWAFRPGDFVAIHGTKQGAVVESQSIRHATDPVLAAAPDLAAGAVLASALAIDLLVAQRKGPPSRLARLLHGIARWRRGASRRQERAASMDDNHSGAPAPKS